MSFPAVEEVIPHAGRMVLIDQILEFSEHGIVCQSTIREDNPYLGSDRQVGPWIALEYLSQALAAHSGLEARERGESPSVGFLLGTRKFKNHSGERFRIGQSLRISARRTWQQSGMALCEGAIHDAESGALLIDAALSVFLPESTEQFDGVFKR